MEEPPVFAGDAVPDTTVGELDDFTAALTPWIFDADVPALLVVAPHPDDEVLGAGGLIGAAVSAGIPVVVLAVTDGTGSHAGIAPEELGRIRVAETETALLELAACAPEGSDRSQVIRTERLGLPDGGVTEHEDALADHIERVLAQLPPGACLAAPVRCDGHPDHDATGRAALRAHGRVPTAVLVEYPVWLWHHHTPGRAGSGGESEDAVEWSAALRFDVAPAVREARDRAVSAFRSQISLDLGTAAGRTSEDPDAQVVVPPAARALMLRDSQVLFVHGHGFGALYAADADPWHVTDRWYEERKYALTLAILPQRRFRRAYEPGCSVGVLTRQLAQRCDEVVATDVVEAAVATARQHVTDPHVDLRVAGTDDWPEGAFDLIVLSELAYYLTDQQFDELLRRAGECLTEEGLVVAVHWRRTIPGAHRSAEDIHRALAQQAGWVSLASYRDDDVLVETFGPSRPSVAESEFGTATHS